MWLVTFHRGWPALDIRSMRMILTFYIFLFNLRAVTLIVLYRWLKVEKQMVVYVANSVPTTFQQIKWFNLNVYVLGAMTIHNLRQFTTRVASSTLPNPDTSQPGHFATSTCDILAFINEKVFSLNRLMKNFVRWNRLMKFFVRWIRKFLLDEIA